MASTVKTTTVKCPICIAAGVTHVRPHRIRDDRNKVTCPTLLKQKCMHCGKKGHTPKYCSELKKEEKDKKRRDYEKTKHEKPTKPTEMKNRSSTNVFEALKQSNRKVHEKGPSTASSVVAASPWKEALTKKAAPEKKKKKRTAISIAVTNVCDSDDYELSDAENQSKQYTRVKIAPRRPNLKPKGTPWSEMESDDEYEHHYNPNTLDDI
jgi:FtsZ-interacting cell division protein ZipA